MHPPRRNYVFFVILRVLVLTTVSRGFQIFRVSFATSGRGRHLWAEAEEVYSLSSVPVSNATQTQIRQWSAFYKQEEKLSAIQVPKLKPNDIQYCLHGKVNSDTTLDLIGTVRIRPQPEGWYLIQGLLIARKDRRKGLATKLMKYVARDVHSTGIPLPNLSESPTDCTFHKLFCFADLELASFYQHCGYNQVDLLQSTASIPKWIKDQFSRLQSKLDDRGSLGFFVLPTVDTTNVVIIQHHLEPKRPTATVPLLDNLSGLNITRLVWRGRIDNDDLIAHINNLERPVLLWVGGKTKLTELISVWSCEENDAKPTFLLLDGTWQEAKAMFRKISCLPLLPRWTLEPQKPSNYGLRKDFSNYKERFGNGNQLLCTAEVVAEVIDQYTGHGGDTIRMRRLNFQQQYQQEGQDRTSSDFS